MKLYSENDSYKLYNGDMLDMLQVIETEVIDELRIEYKENKYFFGKLER